MGSIFRHKAIKADDPRKVEIFALSLEEVVPLCESDDYLERGYAAQALGRFRSKKALPSLMKLSEDEEPEVRADALVAIMEMGGAEGGEIFLKALDDKEGFIVAVALDALAKYPFKEAEKKLEEKLLAGEDGGEIAFKAAIALAGLKSEKALPKLLAEVEGGKERYTSLSALLYYEHLSTEILERIERFHKRWFLHPLEKLESAAILCKHGRESGKEFILKRLYSNKLLDKGYAIELSCRLNIAEAMDYIRDVASDEQHYYCLNALNALVNIGDKRGIELAETFAERAIEADAKADAIRILFYAKVPSAREKIKRALGDSRLDTMRLELESMLNSYGDE
ncbi:MAG: hypothetical protein Kow0090_12470 [Myxococcota bacterium]